jgi:hypothetical protein
MFWEGTEMSSMDDLWNSIVSKHPDESGEFILQQFTEQMEKPENAALRKEAYQLLAEEFYFEPEDEEEGDEH